jgi:hypothetical protein
MSHLWHKIKLLDGHFTYLCKFIIKYILVLLCFRYDVWKKSRDNDNQGKEQRCQRSLEQCGFRSTSVTVTYGTNHPQQIQITNAIVNNLIIQGNISLYMVNTDWFRSLLRQWILNMIVLVVTKFIKRLQLCTRTKGIHCKLNWQMQSGQA